MAWDTDLVLITRVLINDLNTPQKNADIYLQRVLVTAGLLVSNDIALSFDYKFDISNITITPDPLSGDVNDIVAQSLFPMKAACIINQGDFQKAISQGIKVRDGDSAVDTSVGFRGYTDILKFGPCGMYDRLLTKLQASNVNTLKAVLGPHRKPGTEGSSALGWYFDTIYTVLNEGRLGCR